MRKTRRRSTRYQYDDPPNRNRGEAPPQRRGRGEHDARMVHSLGMMDGATPASGRRELFAVASISAALLMTELALTRVFSVVMYYHFAFLAISIALFGISASGVVAYVFRARLNRHPADWLLTRQAVVYAISTILALFWLVRLRVGLDYSRHNLMLMLVI